MLVNKEIRGGKIVYHFFCPESNKYRGRISLRMLGVRILNLCEFGSLNLS